MEIRVGSIDEIAERYKLSPKDRTFFLARARREHFLNDRTNTLEYEFELKIKNEAEKMPSL
jgi:hypothetical protein